MASLRPARAAAPRRPAPALGLAGLLALSVPTPAARADEGMWTFDSPPRAQIKARYGFEPDAEWLTRVQHAAVRIGDGGSGSFVSPQGLLLTNQHVARGQLFKLSSADRDLIRDGFHARTPDAELRCPDLEVAVLMSTEDVSARVQAAVPPGTPDAQASVRRKAEIATIEKESADKTGLRSEVVALYGGAEHWLYRYKRYTDVRLVFAPEEQAAAFGGEFDNFTYPRHALDFTIFRVYEDDRPVRPPSFVRVRATPLAESELVFVAGHPATTSRELTIAQLQHHRDVLNPMLLKLLAARRAALLRYAATGEEAARQALTPRLSIENQLKRLTGQQAGLRDESAFLRKLRAEQALRTEVQKRPELRAAYADAWDRLAAVYKGVGNLPARLAYSNLLPSRLATLALQLVRYPIELARPNTTRQDEFRDSRLESLRMSLLSKAPVYLALEEALLADWLEQARAALGDGDPFVKAALAGATPAEAAQRAVRGTALADVAARQALLDGGAQVVAASTDPLVQLARRVEPVLRALRQLQEERVLSVEQVHGPRIAKARFAVYGRAAYPDATYTLRLSYGQVLGYQKDTRPVPYQTLFYGLLDRALSQGEKPPFQLAPRLRQGLLPPQSPAGRPIPPLGGRPAFDPATPLNFVYTADTIGGNSGSPVLDRDGALVGLNFDSNLEKLPNRYFYVEDALGSRAVGVHAVAILESLGKLYDATPLVAELLGLPMEKAAPPAGPGKPAPAARRNFLE